MQQSFMQILPHLFTFDSIKTQIHVSTKKCAISWAQTDYLGKMGELHAMSLDWTWLVSLLRTRLMPLDKCKSLFISFIMKDNETIVKCLLLCNQVLNEFTEFTQFYLIRIEMGHNMTLRTTYSLQMFMHSQRVEWSPSISKFQYLINKLFKSNI